MDVVLASRPTMTSEELLALPDDGVERWLINGQLREKPMTVRNRLHSRIMAQVAKILGNWLDQQPPPRGQVLCGEAGVRLSRDPDTTVGIDVAYVSAEVAARQTDDTTLIDGVPTLAVEILSPNDTLEDVRDKVQTYRQARVPLVWILHPYDHVVTIHRLEGEPEALDARAELSGEPHLPGFVVPVVELFR